MDLYYCHHCRLAYKQPNNSQEQYYCNVCNGGCVEFLPVNADAAESVAVESEPIPSESVDDVPASEPSHDGQTLRVRVDIHIQMLYSEMDGTEGIQLQRAAAQPLQPVVRTSGWSVGSDSPLFTYEPNSGNGSREEHENLTLNEVYETIEEHTNNIVDRAVALHFDITNRSIDRPISEYTLSLLNNREVTAQEAGAMDCVICLDKVLANETIAEMPCNHSMHQACLIKWLKEDPSCPICRASLGDGNQQPSITPHRRYYEEISRLAESFERGQIDLDVTPSTSARALARRLVPVVHYTLVDLPESTRTQTTEVEAPTSFQVNNASTSPPDDCDLD